MPPAVAVTTLVKSHDLDAGAAENLMRYLADQEIVTTIVPDDRNIVIERVRDELGAWRVCVLTPFGSRIHTPWAMAAAAKDPRQWRAECGDDVERGRICAALSGGGSRARCDAHCCWHRTEAAELVMRQLGSTALFAAKFRESASRALLLPRRRADGRTPLWQQRKRAYDLLAVASRYASFPILLEAYRECLRDVFDMPALMEVLRGIGSGSLRVHTVDTEKASPFAAALLFGYVANYIYDGDAPLAERRAQALSIDQDQLRELMGDADLRELLDLHAIEETEEQLQCLAEGYKARNADGVHDLLLRLGDLSLDELQSAPRWRTVRRICSQTGAGAARNGGFGRGRAAADCRGGCGAVPRCAGRAAAAGLAAGISGSCAGGWVGPGAAICADAWAVHCG